MIEVETEKDKVLFVDLMNLFVRNFSALPMMNSDGDHVGGSYGTINSLRKYINMFQPERIVIVWEGKNSSRRRRGIKSDYKEGRKFTGLNRAFDGNKDHEKKSFSDQLLKLSKYFSILPVHQLMVDYLEADDVIGWLSRSHFFQNKQKIIISTDRDFLQLVDKNTSVYRPIKTKKNRDGEIIDVEYMQENYNCWPENFTIIKSIAGDTSDKIEGVPRVGQKTVSKDFPFLSKEKKHSIQDVIEYSKQQKSKKYQKYLLEENIEIMNRNLKLVQLMNPKISLQSIEKIENKLKQRPSFNTFEFRKMCMKDDINSNMVDRWSQEFSQLRA